MSYSIWIENPLRFLFQELQARQMYTESLLMTFTIHPIIIVLHCIALHMHLSSFLQFPLTCVYFPHILHVDLCCFLFGIYFRTVSGDDASRHLGTFLFVDDVLIFFFTFFIFNFDQSGYDTYTYKWTLLTRTLPFQRRSQFEYHT